ncbi:MAG: hypothetical protein GY834_02555 [Bacteroidetes bacterium]|nr:hypothetical protein [Bacteroidota bacterium]
MYYTESELKQWRKDLPERIQKRIKEIWAKEENANNPTVTINGATIEIVPNNFSYTIGIEVNECIIKNTPSIKKNNNE